MKSLKEFKSLTKAEEAIMQALWLSEPAFIKDIIAVMPSPQPHYNTVSTLIKILVEKGFVSSESLGNAHRYTALISKDDYSRRTVKQLVKGYFNNSFADMVSFFAADKELDIEDMEAILKAMKTGKE